MKKYTGSIILGLIALGFGYLTLIFGVDFGLSLGEHATISEWLFNWIKDPKNLNTFTGVTIGAIGGIGYFFYHIVSFKPKKDSDKSNK